MFVLRMPKILKQLTVLMFMLLFVFIAYNEFARGSYFNGTLFISAAIFTIYQLFKEILFTYKKGQLLAKEVVFDAHIWGRLKDSLTLSYLALLINLIISVYFTETSSYHVMKDLVMFSIYFSLFVFMIAQLFQAVIHHSRE